MGLAAFVLYFNRLSSKASKAGTDKRNTQNQFIEAEPAEPAEIEAATVKSLPVGERELALYDLLLAQYAIDQGLRETI